MLTSAMKIFFQTSILEMRGSIQMDLFSYFHGQRMMFFFPKKDQPQDDCLSPAQIRMTLTVIHMGRRILDFPCIL